MAESPSFLDLASSTSRADFIVACPFPMLVGSVSLNRPKAPQRTQLNILVPSISEWDAEPPTNHEESKPTLESAQRTPPSSSWLVYAVRKVQSAFPAMITIGRTANNDLVLSDVQVSKFHAYFRVTDGRYELADAGSRNGTSAQGRPLVPKGPGVVLRFGDPIRIAHVEFTFLDAGSCWDLLHRLRRSGRHASFAGSDPLK